VGLPSPIRIEQVVHSAAAVAAARRGSTPVGRCELVHGIEEQRQQSFWRRERQSPGEVLRQREVARHRLVVGVERRELTTEVFQQREHLRRRWRCAEEAEDGVAVVADSRQSSSARLTRAVFPDPDAP
jgi:hypothetical protein